MEILHSPLEYITIFFVVIREAYIKYTAWQGILPFYQIASWLGIVYSVSLCLLTINK